MYFQAKLQAWRVDKLGKTRDALAETGTFQIDSCYVVLKDTLFYWVGSKAPKDQVRYSLDVDAFHVIFLHTYSNIYIYI